MCEPNSLIRQNQELRDRLNEDAVLYRRRIDTYRQAQQNQAALVARLQSKVLQYKRKCTDLEERMYDVPGSPDIAQPIKVFFCIDRHLLDIDFRGLEIIFMPGVPFLI